MHVSSGMNTMKELSHSLNFIFQFILDIHCSIKSELDNIMIYNLSMMSKK